MDSRHDDREDAELQRQRSLVLKAARRRRREASRALRNRLLRNSVS
ncbi:MAG: hypothetical protein L0H93_20535 [Nocardioides sp.]|nr:hypothetical protein [Nocardioides sp.]